MRRRSSSEGALSAFVMMMSFGMSFDRLLRKFTSSVLMAPVSAGMHQRMWSLAFSWLRAMAASVRAE